MRWLSQRSEKWGFVLPSAAPSAAMNEEVPDVRIVARARSSFRRPGQSRPVTIQRVTYEGRLIICDVATFRERLLLGCGPAKAYGCGLLTVAPLPVGPGS
jgi:CRISPR system Cascade subunit CasE